MSQRETQSANSQQEWRGVDQRTQPTLLADGFFVMARGVFFGLAGNAERLPGKKLAGLLAGPIFNIFIFGKVALVQSTTALWMLTLEELLLGTIAFKPAAPPAPVLSAVSFFTLNITAPAAYPLYATSFSVQRSTDNTIWTTITAGLATLQVFGDSGLADDSSYYYRFLAVNPEASSAGPSTSVVTLARLPDVAIAPAFSNIVADGFDVEVPPLPAFGVTMVLQESTDDATWIVVNTVTAGQIFNVTGEPSGTLFYYRVVTTNTHGTTNGTSASVTTGAATGNFRISEIGDSRISETGDAREIE